MSRHICHVCRKSYISRELLVRHYKEQHIALLPEGKTVGQELFDNRRGNVGRKHVCVICRKNPVEWNDTSGRYERFCSKRCRDQARARAVSNMKKVYGDANIMKDPEHQQKLQYSRGISGIYTFADKTEIRYMGSYEKDFLSYYEHEMKLSSKDIVECPYYFNYRYKNALHTYIPDFYLVSFDLIIEIKEGTNTHPHMEVDREKEALKEAAVLKYSNHHYIKIVEKDYDELLRLVADLKAKD